MNAENQDQDFEKLQHLLKLKRYELPPPRYFNNFSGQVVSRIRAGRRGSRFESSDDASVAPWLRRLWHAFEGRPAVSGAAVALVCCLMVVAVFFMENTTPQKLDFLVVGGNPEAAGDFATSIPLTASLAATPQLVSSTNPAALLSGPNLFENLPSLQPVPVGGTPLWQKY
jgi:hypothetical protein